MDHVREALQEAGVPGLTMTEIKGIERQEGHTGSYCGLEYEIDFVPKVEPETVVPDNVLPKASSVIIKRAKTGEVGDGEILVSMIEDIVRVRTEETVL